MFRGQKSGDEGGMPYDETKTRPQQPPQRFVGRRSLNSVPRKRCKIAKDIGADDAITLGSDCDCDDAVTAMHNRHDFVIFLYTDVDFIRY